MPANHSVEIQAFGAHEMGEPWNVPLRSARRGDLGLGCDELRILAGIDLPRSSSGRQPEMASTAGDTHVIVAEVSRRMTMSLPGGVVIDKFPFA